MKNLKKFFNLSLALTITSVSTIGNLHPAKAIDYECIARDFLVYTNDNSDTGITYVAYQGSYTSRPDRDPDLVLNNGNEYYKNGDNSVVMTWSAGGGYKYQIAVDTLKGEPTGVLTVKRYGRVILRRRCADGGP
ncbi:MULTISPECIES: hypothetical protein [unclassified Tolypothrix]|nr:MULTISPECIES: hypothetical protein [unclassified Tolypothrix]BAY95998.1 hypothetical protein NIES3275_80750 [Microchaete diplosiphon NIES-3275]EKE96771.1 hypothetical protein FDUTEX481_06313 [Tolypothrix sp. PCC 7601]MBE9084924.1 hypothetical protein [Tolypothrix sp. LEGE 11397]UYD31150.1 hypothetical protein HGR01_40445 [Tolypothrix sp. PCC 7712]UYD38947.1 hypothetical protein HG267_41385 [Tolypothrix sp. PCC 7601]